MSDDQPTGNSEIAALADRVATARGKLPLQHDTALVEVLSDTEINAERELAEWIRAQRRGQRRRAVQDELTAEKRDRRTSSAIQRADEADARWHRRALAARRRVANQDARLAQLYRRAEWSSRALIGVVILGMIWAGVNVQHNLVPSGDMTDPLYWLSYGIEAMISIPIITIMVVATTAARWGRELPRGKVVFFETALLGTTVALNTGPHLTAGHWGKAAEFAIAPVMVGVVIWLHAWVSARYAQLIDSVPIVDDTASPKLTGSIYAQPSDAPHGHAVATDTTDQDRHDDEPLLSSIPMTPLTTGFAPGTDPDLPHRRNGHPTPESAPTRNGKSHNGYAVNGHGTNGRTVNGHVADGDEANGHAPGRPPRSGHTGNGRAFSDGTADGRARHDHSPNGHSGNGHSGNGSASHSGRNGSENGHGPDGRMPSARWAEERSAVVPELVAVAETRTAAAVHTGRANGRTVRTPNARTAHSADDSVPHPAAVVAGRASAERADGTMAHRAVRAARWITADDRAVEIESAELAEPHRVVGHPDLTAGHPVTEANPATDTRSRAGVTPDTRSDDSHTPGTHPDDSATPNTRPDDGVITRYTRPKDNITRDTRPDDDITRDTSPEDNVTPDTRPDDSDLRNTSRRPTGDGAISYRTGRGNGSVTSLAYERAARSHARFGHPAGSALPAMRVEEQRETEIDERVPRLVPIADERPTTERPVESTPALEAGDDLPLIALEDLPRAERPAARNPHRESPAARTNSTPTQASSASPRSGEGENPRATVESAPGDRPPHQVTAVSPTSGHETITTAPEQAISATPSGNSADMTRTPTDGPATLGPNATFSRDAVSAIDSQQDADRSPRTGAGDTARASEPARISDAARGEAAPTSEAVRTGYANSTTEATTTGTGRAARKPRTRRKTATAPALGAADPAGKQNRKTEHANTISSAAEPEPKRRRRPEADTPAHNSVAAREVSAHTPDPDSEQLTLEADPGPEPRHPRMTLDAIAAARNAVDEFERGDMVESDLDGDGDVEIWSVARAICERRLSRLPVEQVAEVLTLADQSWTPAGIGNEVGVPTSAVTRILEAVAKVRRPHMMG